MKIDLHLHSPISRSNGDSIKWDSPHHAIKKLIRNDIKIAAFTDHNKFDPDFYLQIYQLAKTANILFLPAIEVNVVRTDGQTAHLLYIFEQNLSIEQLQEISKIARCDIPKRGISLKKCNTIFSNFNTIKIPHVGKSDHFKYADLLQIEYDAIEISNEEDKNYLSVMKHSDINTSVVAFSDTHMWDEYPQARKLVTVIDDLEIPSFKELKAKLSQNKIFFIRRNN